MSRHDDLGESVEEEPVWVEMGVWPVILASSALSSQITRRGLTASSAEKCRFHGITECGGEVRNRICQDHSTLVFQISLR
ncbi:MAG: hypothetical protein OK442_05125 [Thaumarchaeota archaeon]|nr:hypothetical protein [Nitrososphaerota archaeon]